jgi:hypothetical protein
MTGRLSASFIRSARSRPMTSVEPPAAAGRAQCDVFVDRSGVNRKPNTIAEQAHERRPSGFRNCTCSAFPRRRRPAAAKPKRASPREETGSNLSPRRNRECDRAHKTCRKFPRQRSTRLRPINREPRSSRGQTMRTAIASTATARWEGTAVPMVKRPLPRGAGWIQRREAADPLSCRRGR